MYGKQTPYLFIQLFIYSFAFYLFVYLFLMKLEFIGLTFIL